MGLSGSVRIGRITRRQMSRDSVTLRENPCSNKIIRKIRSIRTEQKTNTEIHGTTRRQVSRDSVTFRENPCSNKNIRSISGIRTEQKQTTRKTTEKHGGR